MINTIKTNHNSDSDFFNFLSRCDKCDFATALKRNLERHHIRVHSHIKPFSCPMQGCGYQVSHYTILSIDLTYIFERFLGTLGSVLFFKRNPSLGSHKRNFSLRCAEPGLSVLKAEK